MNQSFEKGFEKTAFVGALAKTFATRVGSKGLNMAKNVGAAAKKNPMGTAGKGLMVPLVGMEAMSVADKTRSAVTKAPKMTMKSDSFHSYRR